MGKWIDVRYDKEGYGIRFSLSQFSDDPKYRGYAASCQYRYDREKDKYILRMWLKHNSMDSKYRIEYDGIDCQYISGTKKTIRTNICRVVDQMMVNGFFDKYIDKFEFDMKCFDKGYELLSKEGDAESV